MPKQPHPSPEEEDEWSDASGAVAPARGGPLPRRTPAPSPRTPAMVVQQPMTTPLIEVLRKQRPRGGTGPAEMKYLSTTASAGVLSQNTWTSADQLANISAGTGQANRLGREIRLHRLRFVINFSDQAADSLCGLAVVEKVDPTVAGSDIWATNGSTRALLDYPNPAVIRKLYHYSLQTAMTYAGGAFGTTPSYAAVKLEVDVDFGSKGKLIQYDLGGAVVGPSPVAWFGTNESSISADIGTQLWFTDC